jgi:DNA polymerase III subunit beta
MKTMKMMFRKKCLIDAMNVVSKAVATRSTMPILQYVLLRHDGPVCTIEASNIEHTVRVAMTDDDPLQAGQTGTADVLLDPRKTMAIAGQADESVTIEVSKNEVIVRADTGVCLTMPTVDPSAWPMPSESTAEVSHTVTCTGDELASAANYVLHACADEDGKYVLSGVALLDHHLAATDGKVAHWHSLGDGPSGLDEKAICIIPGKTAATMMTLARAHSEAECTLSVTGNNVSLTIGADRVSGTTISGNFPPLAKVIPVGGKPKIAKVDASVFADAIGVVSMAAEAELQAMSIDTDGGKIRVKCRSPQSECVSSIEYDGDWDGVQAMRLLRSALRPLDGQVAIEYRDAKKAIVGRSGNAGFIVIPMV